MKLRKTQNEVFRQTEKTIHFLFYLFRDHFASI